MKKKSKTKKICFADIDARLKANEKCVFDSLVSRFANVRMIYMWILPYALRAMNITEDEFFKILGASVDLEEELLKIDQRNIKKNKKEAK